MRHYLSFPEYMQDQRLVILDIDGTLLNTLPKCVIGTQRFLKKHGGPEVGEAWVREHVFPSTVPEIIRHISKEFEIGFGDEKAAEHEYSTDLADAADATEIYKDVPEFLDALLDQGKTLAIVTGSSNIEVQPSLNMLERALGKRFWDSLVTADDVSGFYKPHPESVRLTFERLGGNIARYNPYTSIGDSIKDILMPRRASLTGGAIFIETITGFEKAALEQGYDLKQNRFKSGEPKPDFVFESVTQMCRAMR